jgi:hypothetical protein
MAREGVGVVGADLGADGGHLGVDVDLLAAGQRDGDAVTDLRARA